MIAEINHITFAVRDLDESIIFYRDVLGFTPIVRWYKGAYLESGSVWLTLTLDAQVRKEPLSEYTHLAFTVAESDFPRIKTRIENSGATVWQENKSEGASVYFLDPNGHKLEIHSSDLKSRLAAMKANPPKDAHWF